MRDLSQLMKYFDSTLQLDVNWSGNYYTEYEMWQTRVRSHKTFRWYSPCSLSFQTPNKTYSLCSTFRNTSSLYFADTSYYHNWSQNQITNKLINNKWDKLKVYKYLIMWHGFNGWMQAKGIENTKLDVCD